MPKDVLLSTVDVVDMSSAIYSAGRKSENLRRENLVPCLSAAIGHFLEHVSNLDDGAVVHQPAHAVKGESVAFY